MIKGILNKVFFYVIIILYGCVEPYDYTSSNTFENLLVVEAKLTDEYGYHEVILTRSYTLNNEFPSNNVEGATVIVVKDSNTIYEYEEYEPGKYISKEEYQAILTSIYQLKITLQTGEVYFSEEVQLPNELIQDFDINVKKAINENGEEGLSVEYINNEITFDDSGFYRFIVNGTYLVVPPYWKAFKFELNEEEQTIDVVPRVGYEGRYCYVDDENVRTYTFSSKDFTLNVIPTYQVNFFNKEDVKIYRRYSIEVQEYLLSEDAYIYYSALSLFSESESVFSENQPGNIPGNLYSSNNTDVLGFFEVSKKITKRKFFDFSEFFDFTSSPDYVRDCFIELYPLNELYPLISNGFVEFYSGNPDDPAYTVVNKVCADCRALGPDEKPDFWED